ncbi:hypothetical protein VFPPC_15707 [Pochonia chlamydosporia 170]|uniref:Uncharacterized protein n=1 Tax=Pochonia chlamydosporia 170 TaxID=1380566 RepID=A0A179FRA6_METCM|nr:hypothetical protein VFPPC_15707 [Pochonia chlamydosporia 170]OAQ67623.1 hypothetical protein VFPPC_15707 [Pochonia chlamydosporia 170]
MASEVNHARFTRVSLHEDPPQYSSYYSAEPDTIPGNGTPGTSTTTNATGSQSTTGDSSSPSYSYIQLRRLPKLKISPWILLIVVRFFHTLWYALPCYLALSAETAVKWPFSSPPPPRWLLYAGIMGISSNGITILLYIWGQTGMNTPDVFVKTSVVLDVLVFCGNVPFIALSWRQIDSDTEGYPLLKKITVCQVFSMILHVVQVVLMSCYILKTRWDRVKKSKPRTIKNGGVVEV